MSQEAVAYIRVSSQEQADSGLSLQAQRRAVEAYAELRGFTLVEVLEDAGVSAGLPLGSRPAGARITKLVNEGVRHVICLKLDRLFRDAVDCLERTRCWDKKGVALHIVDMGGQSVQTNTAMGRFVLTVMAGAAEMEKNLISERTILALNQKRERGERISGEAPFGFRFEGATVVRNPGEQEVMFTVQRLRKRKKSFQSICDYLERKGFLNRNGRPWSRQGLWQIFRHWEASFVQ